MHKYKIFKTDEYLKQFRKLSKKSQGILGRKEEHQVFPQLKDNPYYGPNIKKSTDYTPETWRYRAGDYRILYEIDDTEHIVDLITLDDRKDVYR